MCLAFRDHFGRFLPVNPDAFDPRFFLDPITYRAVYLDDRAETFAIVDSDVWDVISGRRWSLYDYGGKQYARRTVGSKSLYLHRLIAELFLPPAPSEMHFIVDHMNGDGLDNRLGNLRWATPHENATNVRGLYWRQLDLLRNC